MEKYQLLKFLSKVINFISWLSLILCAVIVVIRIYKESLVIETIITIISGLFSFVILLSFGKLIQVTLDIRESQIKISDERNSHLPNTSNKQIQKVLRKSSKKEVKKTINVDENLISELRKLIMKEKKSFISKYKKDIILLLNKIIKSEGEARGLIEQYYNLYQS